MLTDDELAGLRETAESALPDTCAISRATATTDSAGGYTLVWANVATGVACRAGPPTRQAERIAASKIEAVNVQVFTLPWDTDIRPADRIVWSAQTFEVLPGELGSWSTVKRLLCSEVVA